MISEYTCPFLGMGQKTEKIPLLATQVIIFSVIAV
jgi:hypothetical protein